METDLKAQLLQHEGHFNNYDIVLMPNKNDSDEILWKKSYKRKFIKYNKYKMSDTRQYLEIAYVALPPFYKTNRQGNLDGMDANAWKIIGSHLQFNMKFLKAKHMGKTIHMVNALPNILLSYYV